ncbi:MAG: hypothetical protein SVZ03_05745 [Spirochaetota bacterium]|nr:hypothetical protein [Spirochaetota bacterium]
MSNTNDKSRPMPGDIVKITHSNVPLVPTGTTGIIEGMVDKYEEEYLIVFNSEVPYMDDKYVKCTGKPAYFIKSCRLVSTSQVDKQLFWRWENKITKYGETFYKKDVNIFNLEMTNSVIL